MNKALKALIPLPLALVFAMPAFAGHCPKDVKAVDNALGKVNLSSEQKAQVQSLRDEGQALHTSGNHGDSEKKLAEAMRILLNGL